MKNTCCIGLIKTMVVFLCGCACIPPVWLMADVPENPAAPPTIPSPVSLTSELALFLRFIFALAIVLFLLILTLWALKRLSRIRGTGLSDSAIDVLSIRYIERNKAVALVRIVDRVLIVGVAENALTTLGELSSEELDAVTIDATAEPGVFGNVLARFTGRRSEKKEPS